MISEEQAAQVKQQLLQQIESNFPADKKAFAKSQVESMNSEQLMEFLKQNNMIQNPQGGSQGDAVGNPTGGQAQQCIFCSIISGDAQAYKIDENKNAIAILEINPVSKGHSLIIPKQHIQSSDKIPQTVFSLARKIAKKIKTQLKPKDLSLSSANLFGHEIINVLPIYGDETPNSERKKAEPKELEKLQNQLEKKPRPKIIKKAEAKKIKENTILPQRIP